VAPADADPVWDDLSDGAYSHDERALRIAASREVFEESGLVLATRNGKALTASDCSGLDELRSVVEADPAVFQKLVRDNGLRLSLDRLAYFAHWITPAFEPRRFDTHFFLVTAPAGQTVRHDGREAVDHSWISPADVLELRRRGEAKLMFPTRLNLQVLAQSASAAEAEKATRAKKVVTVSPQLEQREHGKVLVIPAEAGYGLTEESIKEVAG
jgi:8-oxo-dGTP pyrophosphatase MutT (NUDIX family)